MPYVLAVNLALFHEFNTPSAFPLHVVFAVDDTLTEMLVYRFGPRVWN